ALPLANPSNGPTSLQKAQLLHVVRAARLRAGAEARRLVTAKGLPPHDRPGDGAIDVEVAGLHVLDEGGLLLLVQAVKAGGEPVGRGVGQVKGVPKVVRGQHREHGAEQLRTVAVTAGS